MHEESVIKRTSADTLLMKHTVNPGLERLACHTPKSQAKQGLVFSLYIELYQRLKSVRDQSELLINNFFCITSLIFGLPPACATQ